MGRIQSLQKEEQIDNVVKIMNSEAGLLGIESWLLHKQAD